MFSLHHLIFSLNRILLVTLFFHYEIKLAFCSASFEFDQTYFGVTFSPFVKHAENGQGYPSMESYTVKNLKTLMKKASTEFSNLIIPGIREDDENHQENATHHENGDIRIFSPEVAALINTDNGPNKLKLFLEVERHEISRTKLHSNARIAMEAAKRANGIHNGTVRGVSFIVGYNEAFALDILKEIVSTRPIYRKLELSIGTSQDCLALLSPENTTLTQIRRKIIKQSDFIICWVEAASNVLSNGPKASFRDVGKILLKLKTVLRTCNSEIEVMAMTSWSGEWNAGNQYVYWQEANKWTVENKFPIFLAEAFDNPLRETIGQSGHLGWWRLKRNSEIDSVDGYMENVSADFASSSAKIEESTFWTVEIFVGVVFGGTIFIFLFSMVRFAFYRMKIIKFREQSSRSLSSVSSLRPIPLSKSSISCVDRLKIIKFRKRSTRLPGSLPSLHHSQAEQNEYNTALTSYDKNKYELWKEDIEIDTSNPLGTGLGIVYSARIKLQNGSFCKVALKVQHSAFSINYMLHELNMLAYLGEHPNIVKLKGAYTAELDKQILYIAMELCSLGTLQSYLSLSANQEGSGYANLSEISGDLREPEYKQPDISLTDLFRWSKEIACGMEYLEMKQVVSINLSTRCVLLTSDRTAKIIGLGELSRRLQNDTCYTMSNQKPLPWQWLAVESIKSLMFSSKSDVWSYGVTLWEIFSKGKVPYADVSWDKSFVEDLIQGHRLACPQYANNEIYQIMTKCWSLYPADRPSFSDLRSELEIIFLEYADAYYLSLFEKEKEDN